MAIKLSNSSSLECNPFPGINCPFVFLRPLKVAKAGLVMASLDWGNRIAEPRAAPKAPMASRRPNSACN